MRLLSLLLPCLVTLGCAGGWEVVDRDALPPAGASRGAGGVVLLDDCHVSFGVDLHGAPVAEERWRWRALIQSSAGADLAHIAIPVRAFSSLVEFRARTVSAAGRTRTWSRRDASELPAISGGELYSDARKLVLDVEPASPGTIVEYEVVVRRSEAQLFAFGQTMGGSRPTTLARLVVEAPDGFEVEHRALRLGRALDGLAPRSDGAGGRTRLTWEVRDVPALELLPAAPEADLRVPEVMVRLRRWRDGRQLHEAPSTFEALSAWLHHRYADVLTPRPEIRQLADRLLAGIPATDASARARRLHAWVRDEIRYCAIEIGWGGWIPHAPDDVLRLRYGDCKDKAGLLSSLLQAAGVSSQVALIRTHEGMPVAPPMPLVTVFNHAIVRVELPGGAVVLDPTARAVPFGELPAGDDASDILPVSAVGSPLERTPSVDPAANAKELELELVVRPGGEARGRFQLAARGPLASSLRGALLATRDGSRGRVIAEAAPLREAVWHEPELAALEPGDGREPLRASGEVVLSHLLLDGGGDGRHVLRLSELLDRWTPSPPSDGRAEPVVLPTASTVKLRMRVRLPQGVTGAGLPPPVAIDGEAGRYRLDWRSDGGVLVVTRELMLRRSKFEVPEQPALRTLLAEALAAEGRAVLLR